jgi:hypothetical protein
MQHYKNADDLDAVYQNCTPAIERLIEARDAIRNAPYPRLTWEQQARNINHPPLTREEQANTISTPDNIAQAIMCEGAKYEVKGDKTDAFDTFTKVFGWWVGLSILYQIFKWVTRRAPAQSALR